MKIIGIIVSLFVLSHLGYAQPDSIIRAPKHKTGLFQYPSQGTGVVIGWDQFSHSFPEFGFGYMKLDDYYYSHLFNAITASYQYNPWQKVHGVRLCDWGTSSRVPISFGVSLAGYFGQGNRDFVIAPMIGFGWDGLQIAYGYNFKLDERDVDGVNQHFVSLRFFLPVSRWGLRPKRIVNF